MRRRRRSALTVSAWIHAASKVPSPNVESSSGAASTMNARPLERTAPQRSAWEGRASFEQWTRTAQPNSVATSTKAACPSSQNLTRASLTRAPWMSAKSIRGRTSDPMVQTSENPMRAQSRGYPTFGRVVVCSVVAARRSSRTPRAFPSGIRQSTWAIQKRADPRRIPSLFASIRELRCTASNTRRRRLPSSQKG